MSAVGVAWLAFLAYRVGGPALAAQTVVSLGALAAILAGMRARRYVRLWHWYISVRAVIGLWESYPVRLHYRDTVYPLTVALRSLLGLDIDPSQDSSTHRLFIYIPVNYHEDEKAMVRIVLPAVFAGRGYAEIESLVRRKLRGNWDARWHEVGLTHVEFHHAPAPPRYVSFADLREEIETAAEGVITLGKNHRKEFVTVDLNVEAPHICLAMNTGAGKSTLIYLMLCSAAQQGAERVDICDPKYGTSLPAVEGIPGIVHHFDPSEWMDAITSFVEEMEWRFTYYRTHPEVVFARRILVLEEMNSFRIRLDDWWEKNRGKGDPKKCPAYGKLIMAMAMGRAANMNVFIVAQSARSNVLGDVVRDLCGIRILSRFTPQQWDMLVAARPRARVDKHPGRAVLALGDDWSYIQMGRVLPAEVSSFMRELRPGSWAAEWRTGLSPSRDATDSPGIESGTSGDVSLPEPAKSDDGAISNVLQLEPNRVTLGQACARGILPMSYDTAKRARQRERERGSFPEGRQYGNETRYTEQELRDWYAGYKGEVAP